MNLTLFIPELVVVAFALLVILLDLFTERKRLLATVSLVGLVIAAGFTVSLWGGSYPAIFNNMLAVDNFAFFFKFVFLGVSFLIILASRDYISKLARFQGEYYALILLATTGMMFLVSSEELLMIFASLELTSLSLYILTAFHKRSAQSAEAALKYFLFGGMAAAFTLFGFSLVYGLSGATNLAQIAEALTDSAMDPLLAAALVMILIGFGFKIAVVPFHLWAPDAYHGAPTTSAAFIASGSKVASFFVLAKVMMVGFPAVEGNAGWRQFVSGWAPILAMFALLSMLLGNLAAIAQSNVRRLLAYSAIAHSGYALLGIMSNSAQGYSSLIYYTVTYALTILGAFGVVSVVEESRGDSKLKDFAGLWRTSPILSMCLMVFMLSLAGIPPLAGFFGKFYLFVAAVGSGSDNIALLWLVIVAVFMSAVSLYYYLQVLKQVFVVDGESEMDRISNYGFTQFAICGLAVLVVLLGCVPNLLVSPIVAAVKSAGFSL